MRREEGLTGLHLTILELFLLGPIILLCSALLRYLPRLGELDSRLGRVFRMVDNARRWSRVAAAVRIPISVMQDEYTRAS